MVGHLGCNPLITGLTPEWGLYAGLQPRLPINNLLTWPTTQVRRWGGVGGLWLIYVDVNGRSLRKTRSKRAPLGGSREPERVASPKGDKQREQTTFC